MIFGSMLRVACVNCIQRLHTESFCWPIRPVRRWCARNRISIVSWSWIERVFSKSSVSFGKCFGESQAKDFQLP